MIQHRYIFIELEKGTPFASVVPTESFVRKFTNILCEMKSTHIYRQFASDASGLIIFKILTEYRGIQGLTSGAGYTNGLGRDITPIIPIMIESGAMTFMAQLVLTLIYKFDFSTAYPIICGFVVQLYVRGFAFNCMAFDFIYPIIQGISTALIIVTVRVEITSPF